MNEEMKQQEQTTTCQHCGNKTPQVFKFEITSIEDVSLSDGSIHPIKIYYFLVQCKTCEKVSLYSNWEVAADPYYLEEALCLYPKIEKISSSVPDIIRRSYNEAKKVEKISPAALVILIGKSLECLCEDKKAEGNNLKNKLDDLAKKGIIPKTLLKMGHSVRLLRNISARPSDYDIKTDEVKIISDFFVAVIEYVYVAPEKIKSLEEKLKRYKTTK
ncbi:hypothetical protein ES703_92666 [subsurface metagenome]